MRRRASLIVGVVILGLLAGPPAPRAADSFKAEDGDVTIVCRLTVGGSFKATTTELTGEVQFDASEPGLLTGAFRVELDELDTGIGLRNTHLREKYLEVGKEPAYARATLSQIRLKGVDAASPAGDATFTANLELHGVTREVRGKATLKAEAAAVHVTAEFSIVLADHGIKKPRYLGVGVKKQVTAKVAFSARRVESDE